MFDFKPLINLAEKLKSSVFLNEPMYKHTSFRIGGPCDLFIIVKNESSLSSLVFECNKNNIPFFILGNGTNLLVKDSGIRGVVLKLEDSFEKIYLSNDTHIVAKAGVALSSVCKFALDNSLKGLEFAWGIPGTIGGAIYMNAGAYGGEMKNIVSSVNHIDNFSKLTSFNSEDLEFSYRSSVYKKNKFIITSCDLQLEKGDKSSIKSCMDDLMKRRKAKQPLDMPSAGSVFKRPTGYYAGTMIEECGLKGARIGDAMVSLKHANFIVNCGKATCDDVINLINFVKEKVYEKTNVVLECEVQIFGEV